MIDFKCDFELNHSELYPRSYCHKEATHFYLKSTARNQRIRCDNHKISYRMHVTKEEFVVGSIHNQ